MKNLITGILTLTFAITNAQTDVIKTSNVLKKTKTNNSGSTYTTKVIVVTEKNKDIQFNPNQKFNLNQDIAKTASIVTKKIMIDNDLDPFYDKTTKIKYLVYDNKKYGFIVDDHNRLVTYRLNNETTDIANILESENPKYKKINNINIDEIGHFEENEFVIEYIDTVNNEDETIFFDEIKM